MPTPPNSAPWKAGDSLGQAGVQFQARNGWLTHDIHSATQHFVNKQYF